MKTTIILALKARAKHMALYIPALLLAFGKRETPWLARILAGMTVAYALSPIDLIPDFIPVLGYLDDLLIVPALAALTVRAMPKELIDRCLKESEGLWNMGRPKRWRFALPILGLWLIGLALIIWLVVRGFAR